MTVEHTREFDTSFSTILIQIPYLSHLWLIFFTGNKGNQDVYIKQSYRKDNGKTSSRIYKKLGKYNDLLAQFSGDETAMMAWAKKKLKKKPCSTTSVGKKLLSPFPLLPVFHWAKGVFLTLVTCSCSSSAPNCGWTTSAEISVIITSLLTTSMPFLRI